MKRNPPRNKSHRYKPSQNNPSRNNPPRNKKLQKKKSRNELLRNKKLRNKKPSKRLAMLRREAEGEPRLRVKNVSKKCLTAKTSRTTMPQKSLSNNLILNKAIPKKPSRNKSLENKPPSPNQLTEKFSSAKKDPATKVTKKSQSEVTTVKTKPFRLKPIRKVKAKPRQVPLVANPRSDRHTVTLNSSRTATEKKLKKKKNLKVLFITRCSTERPARQALQLAQLKISSTSKPRRMNRKRKRTHTTMVADESSTPTEPPPKAARSRSKKNRKRNLKFSSSVSEIPDDEDEAEVPNTSLVKEPAAAIAARIKQRLVDQEGKNKNSLSILTSSVEYRNEAHRKMAALLDLSTSSKSPNINDFTRESLGTSAEQEPVRKNESEDEEEHDESVHEESTTNQTTGILADVSDPFLSSSTTSSSTAVQKCSGAVLQKQSRKSKKNECAATMFLDSSASTSSIDDSTNKVQEATTENKFPQVDESQDKEEDDENLLDDTTTDQTTPVLADASPLPSFSPTTTSSTVVRKCSMIALQKQLGVRKNNEDNAAMFFDLSASSRNADDFIHDVQKATTEDKPLQVGEFQDEEEYSENDNENDDTQTDHKTPTSANVSPPPPPSSTPSSTAVRKFPMVALQGQLGESKKIECASIMFLDSSASTSNIDDSTPKVQDTTIEDLSLRVDEPKDEEEHDENDYTQTDQEQPLSSDFSSSPPSAPTTPSSNVVQKRPILALQGELGELKSNDDDAAMFLDLSASSRNIDDSTLEVHETTTEDKYLRVDESQDKEEDKENDDDQRDQETPTSFDASASPTALSSCEDEVCTIETLCKKFGEWRTNETDPAMATSLDNSQSSKWKNKYSLYSPTQLVERVFEFFKPAMAQITTRNSQDKKLMASLKAAGYCCGEHHVSSQGSIPCNGSTKSCPCSISGTSKYLKVQLRKETFHYCTKHYKDVDTQELRKKGAQISRNQIGLVEELVQCTKCKRCYHVSCRDSQRLLNRNCECGKPQRSFTSPKFLPATARSQHIQSKCPDNFLVRELTSEPMMETMDESSSNTQKQKIGEIYKELTERELQWEYRNKLLLVFCKAAGDCYTLCFAMLSKEYSLHNVSANSGKISIEYIDSLNYVDGKIRTDVFHTIINTYLDLSRNRDFTDVRFWACPPEKDVDYLLPGHPVKYFKDEKGEPLKRLLGWYDLLCQNAQEQGIVERSTKGLPEMVEDSVFSIVENVYEDNPLMQRVIFESLKSCKKPTKLVNSDVQKFTAAMSGAISSNENELFNLMLRNVDNNRATDINNEEILISSLVKSRDHWMEYLKKAGLEFSCLSFAIHSTAKLVDLVNKSILRRENDDVAEPSASA